MPTLKVFSTKKPTFILIGFLLVFFTQTLVAKSVPPYKDGFTPKVETHQLTVLLDKNNKDTDKFVNDFAKTRNQKPETRNQKPETRNQKPETRNQKPETRNQKPETRNQKPNII